jgi:hypothetical protein
MTSCEEKKSVSNENVAILMNQSGNILFPYRESNNWRPTYLDLETVEQVLNEAVKNNVSDFFFKPVAENFNDYYIQYVPYFDENGNRIIYVNGICEKFVAIKTPDKKTGVLKPMDWKNIFFEMDDGGHCFWQMQINVDTKEYYQLSVNSF